MRKVCSAIQYKVRAMISNPPLAEQRWIVAKVAKLTAAVDALETQVAAFVAELSGRASVNADCSAT